MIYKYLLNVAVICAFLAPQGLAHAGALGQLAGVSPAGRADDPPGVVIPDGNLMTMISDKSYASRREAETDMLLARARLTAQGMEILGAEVLRDSRDSYYFTIRYRKGEFKVGRFNSPLLPERQAAQDKLAEMSANMDAAGLKTLATNVRVEYGVTTMYAFELSYAMKPNLLLETLAGADYQDKAGAEAGAAMAAAAMKQTGIPVMVSFVAEAFSGAGKVYRYQVVYARDAAQDWAVTTYTSPMYDTREEARTAMNAMTGAMPGVLSAQVQVKYDGVLPRYYFTVTYKAAGAAGAQAK